MCVDFLCPLCHEKSTLPADFLGKKMDCPHCHRQVLVVVPGHRQQVVQHEDKVPETDLTGIADEPLATGLRPHQFSIRGLLLVTAAVAGLIWLIQIAQETPAPVFAYALYACLAVGGAVSILAAARQSSVRERLNESGLRTRGVVTGFDQDQHALVRFRAASGVYEIRSIVCRSSGRNALPIGRELSVLYLEESPQVCALETESKAAHLAWSGITLIGLSVVMAVLTYIGSWP